MSRVRLSLAAAGFLFGFLMFGTQAHAQATRTWVSGVGDDVNPCSRTAPCKTFAGAISKTAAGGQINVLDPGAFGAVTITKSITIDAGGTFAGVLATLGSNGIVVNAAATDIVVLRGLTIDGAGSGANGVRFLAGAALHVEECVIRAFRANTAGNGHGIAFQPSGASELYVTNTVVTDNGVGVNGGGILIKPSGSGSAKGVINRSQVANNLFGIKADGTGNTGGINVTVMDSVTSGNSTSGITSQSPAGGATTAIMVVRATSTNNAGSGIVVNGPASSLRISDSTVTGNNIGLEAIGGFLATYGNNNINANTTDGSGALISQN